MHPGESATSFAMQGFLELLLSSHPIALILRQNFVFKVLPMVNPDGVFLGNNRCNLIGQDLNRVWNVATEFSHPTVFAARNLLKELDSSEVSNIIEKLLEATSLKTSVFLFNLSIVCFSFQCYQIDFVLDLHGHTTSNGSFIYGNTYDNVFRYERHLVFPKLLSANAPDFASEHMMFNADERKHGSLRRFCCETLTDTANAYTLEISMGGYQIKGSQDNVQYTEEDCTAIFITSFNFPLLFL